MHPVVEVLYNQPLSIDCVLLAGCAEAEVWWVTPDGTIVTESTLELEAPHSPGIYKCFARNENGGDSFEVVLNITGKYSMPA